MQQYCVARKPFKGGFAFCRNGFRFILPVTTMSPAAEVPQNTFLRDVLFPTKIEFEPCAAAEPVGKKR